MMRSAGGRLLLTVSFVSTPLTINARWPLHLFRWGVFLLACLFLAGQLHADKGRVVWSALQRLELQGGAWPAMAMALLLVPVNWSIEAWKWRKLVYAVEPVSPARALLATLAGTSVGLVTPNRTGEFLGRVLFLPPQVRVSAAFASIPGGIAQFVVTLVMGALALMAVVAFGLALPWQAGWTSTLLMMLTALVCLGASVVYLHPRWFRSLVLQVPLFRRFSRHSKVLHRMDRSLLLLVLGLALLRYVVFAVQFVILCIAFGTGPGFATVAMLVPVIFLVGTLIPTLVLTELGVRGALAVAFLVPQGADATGVLLATTVLWAINLLAPAVLGSVLLVSMRVRTS